MTWAQMSDRLEIELSNRQQAWIAIKGRLFPFLANVLQGGGRWVLTVSQAKRSDAENRMLHAMLGHISKNVEWAGKKRDIETWKRLLVAAWCRAIGEQIEMLPSLDGHGIDIVFRKTSKLSRSECADLIEFIFAWCAQNDIALPDVDRGKIGEPAMLVEQQCRL